MDCYMSPAETMLTTVVHGKCWYWCSPPFYYCSHNYVLKLGSDSLSAEFGVGHQTGCQQVPECPGYKHSQHGFQLQNMCLSKVTFSVFSMS